MTAALGHPLDWHLHLFWLLAVPALGLAYVRATRAPDRRPSPHQLLCFGAALVLLLATVTWPMGDLAAHWSLLALVVQRLVLTLALPPLLVAGTPRPVIAGLTRPAPVDAVLRLIVKPIPAVIIVTAVAVGSLTTGAVSWSAGSELAQVAIALLVLLSGFVLWAPVLNQLPGAHKLSALGRGGYLIVQSIVPSFLSVVWIFARRPLYASYNHHTTFAGLSPVLDQQLAGFLAKLSTIAVLWTVAFTIMSRAQVTAGADEEGEPLMWSDVEREIERAERRDRRQRWSEPPATPPATPPAD
ncbi:MAG TPA: cytochrome c oxidase assembly protein [Acidimicrobiales bacterium]|nr:cytochrome c oxidase assembly protein [Acidimicrobiales bacterium]